MDLRISSDNRIFKIMSSRKRTLIKLRKHQLILRRSFSDLITLDVIVHCFLLIQVQADIFDKCPVLSFGCGNILPECRLLLVDPRDEDDDDTHDDPNQSSRQNIHRMMEIVAHPGQRYPEGKTAKYKTSFEDLERLSCLNSAICRKGLVVLMLDLTVFKIRLLDSGRLSRRSWN